MFWRSPNRIVIGLILAVLLTVGEQEDDVIERVRLASLYAFTVGYVLSFWLEPDVRV